MEQKALIISTICDCKEELNKLPQTIDKTMNDSLKWFQHFCDNLVNLILLYTKHSNCLKQQKAFCNSVLLHVMHLKENLLLLIEIFTTEEEIGIILKEARRFVVKQLNWCFDSLLHDLNNSLEINEHEDSFVSFMDLALEKLLEFDFNRDRDSITNTLNEFRGIVEEVLSHAMSVAQIAVEHHDSIKGSSQSVLEALDSLEKEIEKDTWNLSMCKLFVEVCNNKLCALERKINITVLKLCLSTFSYYKSTLERLHAFCLNDAEKTENEVDNLVAEFDLMVDKLVQIGFFAVACSTNTSRVTEIKNSLVALEALEVELVPALTAIILDKSVESLHYAIVLKNFWIKQTKALQDSVYFIIDPSAFSSVIYEDLKNDIEGIDSRNLTKATLEPVLVKTRILIDFFTVLSNDLDKEELYKIKPKYKKVKIAFHELKSAVDILLNNESNDGIVQKKLLKRCKILLNMVKQLWLSTNEDESNAEEEICNTTVKHIGNPLIDHCIERGQEILKERSILKLSKIPNNKSSFISLNKVKKETPLLKVLFQKRMKFANSQMNNEDRFNSTIKSIANDMSHMTKALECSERKQ